MASSPRIAVITPVYDKDVPYLRRAYESLLDQTEQDWEWVIGQDATDEARAALSETGDRRIRFACTHHRLGPAGARNVAAVASRAPLLMNLDADDRLADPGVLGRTCDALESGQADWLVSPAIDVAPDGTRTLPPLYRGPGKIDRHELVERWYQVNVDESPTGGVSPHPTTVAASADAFLGIGGYPALTVGEDTVFLLRLNREYRGLLLDSPSHLYHKRDDSMMTADEYASARAERVEMIRRFFPRTGE